MSGRPHVLLVDDEADLRTICELAFERDGAFRLSTAASRDEALACLRTDPPAALVLDVMLPGVAGLELLEQVRLGWPALPVLLLTARTQPPDVAAYRAAGASAVVAKPFDPRALPERIRRLIPASRPA